MPPATRTQSSVTRTLRAAVKIGEDYVTIEESITLASDASDADIAAAVALGWRIYTQQVETEAGQFDAWLQMAQSLTLIDNTQNSLLRVIIFGLPLTLLAAAGGGLFIADRALRPALCCGVAPCGEGMPLRSASAVDPPPSGTLTSRSRPSCSQTPIQRCRARSIRPSPNRAGSWPLVSGAAAGVSRTGVLTVARSGSEGRSRRQSERPPSATTTAVWPASRPSAAVQPAGEPPATQYVPPP